MSDNRLDPKIFDYVENKLSIQSALQDLELNRFHEFKVLLQNHNMVAWTLLNTSEGKELWKKHRNWSEFKGFYFNVFNAMYDAVEDSWGFNVSD